jgi:hypothetical protein
MKAFFFTFLAVLFWALVGHFFSSFTISTTAFYLPIIFIVIAVTIGKETNKFVYIGLCFMSILLNDYLFRLYGGGIHDDAGRGWCELIFYITLFTTTITMLYVAYTMIKEKEQSKILLYFGYVIVCAFASYLLFKNFSVNI